MRRTLGLAIAVVCASLVPSSVARAQDAPAALAAPGNAPSAPVVEDDPDEDAPEQAAVLELSAGVSPVATTAGGLGGLAGLGNIPSLQIGIDVGVALDPRIFVVLGGAFAHASAGSSDWLSISVPLLLQVYLDDPRVGAVIPTIRVGVIGRLSASDVAATYGVGARLAGGITWIASRWIGLRLEMGGTVSGTASGETTWVEGALDVRGSLVLRM